MRRSTFLCSILACLCAVACGGVAADPQPADPGQRGIERTIVHLAADGSHLVQTEIVTAEEQARELAAHQQLALSGGPPAGGSNALTYDGGCAGSSMWIFDNSVAQVGTGLLSHEICFFRNNASGCVDLRQYVRLWLYNGHTYQPSYWASGYSNWIGAYWSGSDEGYFTGTDGFYSSIQGFSVYQRVDNAPSQYWVQHAQYLCFP